MNKINKKFVGLVIVIAVIVGGLSFWAGTKYVSAKGTAGAGNAFARTRGTGGANAGNFAGRGGAGAGGGFTGGKVIAMDATSMTVQGQDGSSKIVLFTAGTPVMKMVAGTSSDIVVGQNITVVGTANPDGSVSASSIQLRPAQAAITPKNS